MPGDCEHESPVGQTIGTPSAFISPRITDSGSSKDVIISDPDNAQLCDIFQIVLTLAVGIAPIIVATAI